MKKVLLIVLAFISVTAYSQRYRRSDGTAIQKPILVSNIPSGMGYYYDTSLFKYRPFQSTAEVLSFYPNLPDRQGSFTIYIKTGGTLASGVITGGTLSKWWFKNGTADSNLVVQDDYRFLANQPTIPVIPAFKTVNGNAITGTGDITVGGIANGVPFSNRQISFNSVGDSIVAQLNFNGTIDPSTGHIVLPKNYLPSSDSSVITLQNLKAATADFHVPMFTNFQPNDGNGWHLYKEEPDVAFVQTSKGLEVSGGSSGTNLNMFNLLNRTINYNQFTISADITVETLGLGTAIGYYSGLQMWVNTITGRLYCQNDSSATVLSLHIGSKIHLTYNYMHRVVDATAVTDDGQNVAIHNSYAPSYYTSYYDIMHAGQPTIFQHGGRALVTNFKMQNHQQIRPLFCLFGDSNTDGMWSGENMNNRYASILRNAVSPAYGFEEMAISGSSIVTMMADLQDIYALQPKYAIINHGVNHFEDSISYMNTVNTMIDSLISHDITPILITPQPWLQNNSRSFVMQTYRNCIMSFANKYRVINTFDSLIIAGTNYVNPIYAAPDGHGDSLGNAVMARIIIKQLAAWQFPVQLNVGGSSSGGSQSLQNVTDVSGITTTNIQANGGIGTTGITASYGITVSGAGTSIGNGTPYGIQLTKPFTLATAAMKDQYIIGNTGYGICDYKRPKVYAIDQPSIGGFTDWAAGDVIFNQTTNHINVYQPTSSTWKTVPFSDEVTSPTLQTATNSGATTTNAITAAGATLGGNTYGLNVTKPIIIQDGTQGAGYVLGSDNYGVTSWKRNNLYTISESGKATLPNLGYGDIIWNGTAQRAEIYNPISSAWRGLKFADESTASSIDAVLTAGDSSGQTIKVGNISVLHDASSASIHTGTIINNDIITAGSTTTGSFRATSIATDYPVIISTAKKHDQYVLRSDNYGISDWYMPALFTIDQSSIPYYTFQAGSIIYNTTSNKAQVYDVPSTSFKNIAYESPKTTFAGYVDWTPTIGTTTATFIHEDFGSANYAISTTAQNAACVAMGLPYVTNKTATSFDLVFATGSTGEIKFEWSANVFIPQN